MTFDGKYSVGFCSFQTELILICTTLYALVKNLFLDIEEADGILITERKVLDCLQSNVELKVEAPQSLRVKLYIFTTLPLHPFDQNSRL